MKSMWKMWRTFKPCKALFLLAYFTSYSLHTSSPCFLFYLVLLFTTNRWNLNECLLVTFAVCSGGIYAYMRLHVCTYVSRFTCGRAWRILILTKPPARHRFHARCIRRMILMRKRRWKVTYDTITYVYLLFQFSFRRHIKWDFEVYIKSRIM